MLVSRGYNFACVNKRSNCKTFVHDCRRFTCPCFIMNQQFSKPGPGRVIENCIKSVLTPKVQVYNFTSLFFIVITSLKQHFTNLTE